LLFELVDALICSSQEICEPKGTDGRCFFALTFSGLGSRSQETLRIEEEVISGVGRMSSKFSGTWWRLAFGRSIDGCGRRTTRNLLCGGLAWGMATIRDKMGHSDYAGPILRY
jgi:hypothetical protein